MEERKGAVFLNLLFLLRSAPLFSLVYRPPNPNRHYHHIHEVLQAGAHPKILSLRILGAYAPTQSFNPL